MRSGFTYHGLRDARSGKCAVLVYTTADERKDSLGRYHIGEELTQRLDLRRHSSSGFDWGYGGSGPSQLALAILAHHLEDDQRALDLYQKFKFEVVNGFDYPSWKVTSEEISGWVGGQ